MISLTDGPQRDINAYKSAMTGLEDDIEHYKRGIFVMGDSTSQIDLLDQDRRAKQYSTVQIGERAYNYGYAIGNLLSGPSGQLTATPTPIGYDVCRADNAFECNGPVTSVQ